MQGHVDEADYLKGDAVDDFLEESKEPLLHMLKTKLFVVFTRINAMKVAMARHYHVLLILIETCHLLSIVLNDGSYSQMGPYATDTPWNHGQTQWLIDVCWALRLDRYLRTSLGQFVGLMCVWAGLIALMIGLCLFLAFYSKTTAFTNLACKLVKVLLTLFTNILFIPICDSFAFGAKCSLSGGTQCLGIASGYGPMLGFIGALAVFLLICGLSTILYYDLCMVCGNLTAKPHPRIKLLRLISYVTIVIVYYFVDINGKVIVFLIIALLIACLLAYIYAQYLPYYSLAICRLRLSALTLFLSAVFCMLIGEFFKSTDQTNSSVSMLFYFLTPCLVQILLLALDRRCQIISTRKFQQITNIYQVEIKGRLLVLELEKERGRSLKSLYGEGEGLDSNFQQVETRILTELEALYLEAFRKFPNSEYLYLWAGLIQLHIFKNYILAMVQCFKGLALANKLDSQYALAFFRKTSESFYKAHMKDDAYDFVQFERCSAIAQRHDETVTRAQFHFWSELEGKTPRIQKLMKLAKEMTSLVNRTKDYYQALLKLNGKSTSALRMFGGFLQSLSGYSEMGQRYLQKAEAFDNPDNSLSNSAVINTAVQPLSFFDAENAIITVSGDFETIGEIQKVGVAASTLFGYLQAEFVGRNISLLIPEPFAGVHDNNMRQFHETGHYITIDVQNLVLYYVNKKGFLFEARTLIKVVPNANNPPFFLAAVKPRQTTDELAMLSTELMVTSYSQGFADLFELGGPKNADLRIVSLIPNFEDLRARMMEPAGCELPHTREDAASKLICRLSTLTIGQYSAHVLRIHVPSDKDDIEIGGAKAETQGAQPTVSTLKAGSNDISAIKPLSSESSAKSESESEDSDSEESDSEGKESSGESPEFQVPHKQASSKRITFPDMPPGTVGDGSLPDAGNEARPLIKRNIRYSDSPDILYEEPIKGGSSQEQVITEKAEPGSSSSRDPNSSQEPSSSRGHSEEPPPDEPSQEEEVQREPSASSKGSSMASSAQFTKALKALISYQFSTIQHHVLRFKITLFLTMLLLIAISVATFQVIQSAISFNESLSHYVNLVGRLRLSAQSVSYYSRMLTLMDAGMFPADNKTDYEKWMTADTEDMHSINLELYQNFGLLNAADREVYFQEWLPVWVLEGTDIVSLKSNLFDATANIVVQAFLLLQDSPTFNFSNRRLFYLYRNGLGETLQTLNDSSKYYVNAAIQDIKRQQLIAIMLIVVSVILLVLCAGFAIIPALRALERAKAEIWEIFFEMPVYVCRIMRSKCGDRLQILNETANLEIEEINPEGERENEENKDDGDRPRSKEKSKDKKKNKRTEKGVLMYDPKARKVVLAKLLCFFVINVVYFYLIYYMGFEAAGELLYEEPVAIDWASRRCQLSRSINHWVTESLLENVTSVGYKFVVHEGQPLASPSLHALMVVNELEYVENSLIFGNTEEGLSYSGIRSTAHDDLLFSNACAAPTIRSLPDCASVADKALAQGLHSAVGMYLTLARTLLIKISEMSADNQYNAGQIKEMLSRGDLALLRSLDERYLHDPLAYSAELYESDFSSGHSRMNIYQNLLISLYIISAVLFYLFIYHPMIHLVGSI